MKELKIEVPKGYEIDKENSTFECIKFKKKKQVDIKTWRDLCEAGAISSEIRLSGYYISDYYSDIYVATRIGNGSRNVFLTEKEAISARAAAMISQLMPYYGGAITDEEWSDKDICKHTIVRCGEVYMLSKATLGYSFLAFHTEEQRDSFYRNNEHLVKDYLMIN